jgi:hypothetical protein
MSGLDFSQVNLGDNGAVYFTDYSPYDDRAPTGGTFPGTLTPYAPGSWTGRRQVAQFRSPPVPNPFGVQSLLQRSIPAGSGVRDLSTPYYSDPAIIRARNSAMIERSRRERDVSRARARYDRVLAQRALPLHQQSGQAQAISAARSSAIRRRWAAQDALEARAQARARRLARWNARARAQAWFENQPQRAPAGYTAPAHHPSAWDSFWSNFWG